MTDSGNANWGSGQQQGFPPAGAPAQPGHYPPPPQGGNPPAMQPPVPGAPGQYPPGAYPPGQYPPGQYSPAQPMGFAAPGYQLAPKPSHPAKGYIVTSIILGVLALLLLFVAVYAITSNRQVINALKADGTYTYAVAGVFARVALIVLMMAGVSGLSTFKKWSIPVLGTYAVLMATAQIVDIVITMQSNTAGETGRRSRDEETGVQPQVVVGYAIYFAHIFWTMAVISLKSVKQAIAANQPPVA